MKICWDNLEKLTYKNGRWNSVYYEKICINCNEEYLGLIDSKFCSHKCAKSTQFHPRLNIKHTKETKEKMSKSTTGVNNPSWKCGADYSWYDTYAERVSFAEEIRRAPDNPNILEVKCKYCGKWFKPNKRQTKNRIGGLTGKINSESLFYCSEECKHACPIYKKVKITPGLESESSREVQPELRKLVLERDNYTCQKCGLSSNNSCVELHCHHIDPVKANPIESADMDNCITLCKDCHLEAHQKDGCKTGQLATCSNY